MTAPGGVTIRDIARAAGVSAGTISRALKNEPGLTESTRQMVLSTARELGYDFCKLRPKRLRRLTFLLHRQHNTASSSPFYSPVLHGAEEACRKQGIVLSFMAVGPADGLADQLRIHAPDAIVCAGFFEPELLTALRGTGKPIVLIDMKLRGYSSVNPDNMMGGYLATKHLIDRGRERVGFISGSLSHYSIRERARGYRQALYEAGILADPRLEAGLPDGVDLETGAWEATDTLLALPKPPDALFCYNDSAALVAMRCCLAKGLKVPHDISIVGFDDISTAVLGHRPLTTLRINKKELGAMGVAMLLDGRINEVEERISPVELVIRASTVCQDAPRRRSTL
ncbi:LacI family DNA-binding transcriptional regulator [Pseudoduganella plicata]|uniref:LacI family transcriptional regulator n=1 Tax=Pseudoduganella plicata TaxID=321984 RepID=A0A4P7BD44_9BURK|nr:LacI family DNA-binding transcriptional regulator [Pseudoduganella plicata]QBQ36053.1 LacI family transcriptional regulator [Pseudoduganella plicata]GGY78445.1 LacI family transcriptional regulator [Pseudoduganella plicata]